ncbi:MAG: NADH-quinone oxidoreductase subunit M [Candidatus Krumholzibacteriia bacterium]
MSLFADHILTWVTFLPAAGALLILLALRGTAAARWTALAVSLADLALSLPLLLRFDVAQAGDQFVERAAWLAHGRISYAVAIDGISLFLVLLTTFLGPLVIVSCWRAITERVPEFMAFLLLLQTAMLGTFVARDMLLFYVFWEAMLIPMAFIIGIWGGERRVYAAVKFFIFTMVGSIFMLVAILYCYARAGSMALADFMALRLPPEAQMWLFAAFALAFAIKVPLFPLHTWLPDAHVEAPTAGSVILAAILLKMGTYGLLRFAIPLFPHAVAVFAPWLALLAVIGIVYGALVAMVQPDMKKLVAYSSVSHLGFVVLGLVSLTPEGVAGGIFQMLAHGLSTGALFLLVGVIYERRHTRLIADFGGLAHVMPRYAAAFMLVTLASIGLPGLCGFVGEFLILFGTFRSDLLPHARLFAAVAATGVVLGAIYMLWLYQRVFFGPVRHEQNRGLPDLRPREVAYLLPILIAIIWLGMRPAPLLDRMQPSIERLLAPLARELAGPDDAARQTARPGAPRFASRLVTPPEGE